MANRFKLQVPQCCNDVPWDPEKALADALSEKAAFLDKHPQHAAFQKQIDRMLDKAGSAENRMTVLAILMEAKLVELHHQLQKLNNILLNSGKKPELKNFLLAKQNLMRISNN